MSNNECRMQNAEGRVPLQPVFFIISIVFPPSVVYSPIASAVRQAWMGNTPRTSPIFIFPDLVYRSMDHAMLLRKGFDIHGTGGCFPSMGIQLYNFTIIHRNHSPSSKNLWRNALRRHEQYFLPLFIERHHGTGHCDRDIFPFA